HTGKIQRKVQHGFRMAAFYFNPDGNSLLTAGLTNSDDDIGWNFTVKTWDNGTASEQKEIKIVTLRFRETKCVAFSSDGQKVALAIESNADNQGEISVWRISDGALLRRTMVPNLNEADLAFSPDGWRLAVAFGTGTLGKQGEK